MSIVTEAAYIYIFSRELFRINKKLGRAAKKAHKHKQKHANAPTHKKEKYHLKYARAVQKTRHLMDKHNQILSRLREHNYRFAHLLRVEHRIDK